LIRAETKRKKKQEQTNSTFRMLEKTTRQAEKYLSVGHKRRLVEMGVDVEKKREVDMRAQEELDRQHRTNTRQLEKQLQETQEDLCGTKAEKEELERAVTWQRKVEWFTGIRRSLEEKVLRPNRDERTEDRRADKSVGD
jgi:hypothetical protein